MRHDKEKAFSLRKEGKSYKEIHKILDISMSTLSDWFRNESWSKNIQNFLTAENIKTSTIRIKNLDAVRGKKLKAIYAEAREEARATYPVLREDQTFIAGLVAYWGEGDKASVHTVRITNTDPGIIKLFKHFLMEICQTPMERVKVYLLLYPDLKVDEVRKYWSSQIGMPLSSFNKPVYIQGRHKTKRSPYGVCTLCITSRYLKEKMLVWLELFRSDILSKAGMV